MSRTSYSTQPDEAKTTVISQFVGHSTGLQAKICDQGRLHILQKADNKVISFDLLEIEEVLERKDSEGKDFLQINFSSGKKILLTETLVGFKPASSVGLDGDKLPKVVTTPDLISVVEAIEEALGSGPNTEDELQVLRKVFDAVLSGAEAVGFDLSGEKAWLHRMSHLGGRGTA